MPMMMPMRPYHRLAVAVLAQAVKDRPDHLDPFKFQTRKRRKKGQKAAPDPPEKRAQLDSWANRELRRRQEVQRINDFLASDTLWHDLMNVRGDRTFFARNHDG